MGVGPGRVEDFAGPEEDDHFGGAQVFNRVSIARRNIYDFPLAARDRIIDDRLRSDHAKADDALSFQNEKLFRLRLMEMVSTHYSHVRTRDKNLPKGGRFDELRQSPTCVGSRKQLVRKLR